MSKLLLTEGSWARVRLLPDCPARCATRIIPAEDGMRVKVTTVRASGDPSVRGNYQGGLWATVLKPTGGLGIGRYFRPDELEVLAPGRVDPTEEEQAEVFRQRWHS